MTQPMPDHLFEFRSLLAKWEHGEMTLEELYEMIRTKFSEKQLTLF